jgi:hypothetical protein
MQRGAKVRRDALNKPLGVYISSAYFYINRLSIPHTNPSCSSTPRCCSLCGCISFELNLSSPHLMAPLSSRRFHLHFPYLPALLLLFSELAELILTSPRIRLLEASICRRHYLAYDPSGIAPDGSIDEALCKLEDIQTRLAYIRGWQVFFEAIPVMALAVPWGALADRVGRKKVLAVNFVGCMMHICWFLLVCHPRSTMSAEWVWVSALAFALGGGPRTAGVLIMALVNDTSPSTER